MTVKKIKFFLASEIDKEAQWLTEMSAQGLHFFKFRFPFYYFKEDSKQSFLYQTDFQDSSDEYFQLYEDAGWEHVLTYLNSFHYFRVNKETAGDARIYTDPDSLKKLYERMLRFYLLFFLILVITQIGLFTTWRGLWIQKFTLGLILFVIAVYVFLFFRLLWKSRSHK